MRARPVNVEGRIEAVRTLGAGVREIVIDIAPATVRFLPGQYLQILHDAGSAISFSSASAPAELPRLRLHYLAQQDSDDALRMDTILAGDGRLELSLPHGDCGFTAPLERPLLALAGGSGIAQVRSILHSLLPETDASILLYWGVARPEDLYLRAELDALAARHGHFRWVAVTEAAPDEYSMRQGRVADALATDLDRGSLRLEGWDVLIAGGPPMVWGTVSALVDRGLRREQVCADAFSYAPRDGIWPATRD